ncbi:MAG TPA: hypothetical protein VFW73_11230 [Lacipirellulaceae bacterium]|nr:hypothetical protein [Lacipirellulaceae bacterium]
MQHVQQTGAVSGFTPLPPGPRKFICGSPPATIQSNAGSESESLVVAPGQKIPLSYMHWDLNFGGGTDMKELEITWERIVRIWWLIAWRTVLGSVVISFVLGGIAGAVFGFIAARSGVPRQSFVSTARFIGLLVGVLTWIVWGIVVVRMAFRKKYGDFRLALIANSET